MFPELYSLGMLKGKA